MKIFIYKTIIVLISAIIVFKVTIGQTIKSYENKINSMKSKDNRENILNKIKDEIKSANNKDRIFTDEERILLSTFINKIRKEINLKDSKQVYLNSFIALSSNAFAILSSPKLKDFFINKFSKLFFSSKSISNSN